MRAFGDRVVDQRFDAVCLARVYQRADDVGFVVDMPGLEFARAGKKTATKTARLKGNGARPLYIKSFGVHACPAGQSCAPQGKFLKIGVLLWRKSLRKNVFRPGSRAPTTGFLGHLFVNFLQNLEQFFKNFHQFSPIFSRILSHIFQIFCKSWFQDFFRGNFFLCQNIFLVKKHLFVRIHFP